MKHIIIVGLLAALSGVSKAVKDTISHHYSQSVFAQLDPQYWNPAESWKNKYQDWDAGQKEPRFLLATTWLVALTDAWHTFDSLHRLLLIGAGLCGGLAAGKKTGYNWHYWRHAWYWFVFILVSGAAGFHVFYHYVFI